MAIRNYKELSSLLQKITERLLVNQDLCKLLHYTQINPLAQPNLTDAELKKFIGDEIRFIPRVGLTEVTKSKIVLVLPRGEKLVENAEITRLPIDIYVYTPYTEWVIEGDDLRIFLIMSKIEELLDGKNIGGIGNFNSLEFEMIPSTDEICAYRMGFRIDLFK